MVFFLFTWSFDCFRTTVFTKLEFFRSFTETSYFFVYVPMEKLSVCSKTLILSIGMFLLETVSSNNLEMKKKQNKKDSTKNIPSLEFIEKTHKIHGENETASLFFHVLKLAKAIALKSSFFVLSRKWFGPRTTRH